jgi:hypothetical protein
MEIKIDSGVPLPEKRGKWAVVVSKMAVGDSFEFATTPAIKNALRVAAHRLNKSITFRDDLEAKTSRVWVIETKKEEQTS